MLRHPGHWIVFIKASINVAFLPLYGFILWNEMIAPNIGFLVLYGLTMSFPLMAYAFALWHQHTRQWKAVFIALVVLAAAQFVAIVALMMGIYGMMSASWIGLIFTFAPWGSLLLAVAMLFISVRELLSGNQRDWLHWLGVIAYVVSVSIHLLWGFAIYFMRLFGA